MERWCRRRGQAVGTVLPVAAVWSLARAWYGGRLDPAFRGRSAEQAEAIFRGVGLTGPFWSL